MRPLPVVALVLVVTQCNLFKSKQEGDAGAASTTTLSSAAAASASAGAATKPLPCQVEAAVTVDTGVRTDSGLMLVELTDKRLALGYATGTGEPKVAIIDAAGHASFAEVEDEHLKDKEKKGAKTQRVILRVTPLGFKQEGMKMRVGVDMLDTMPDKTKYLRCGPADVGPYLFEGGPEDNGTGDEGNLTDCRTFSDGKQTFVLASLVSIASAMDGRLPMRWIVDTQPGKNPVENAVLDEKTYDAKKLEKPEAYEYQVPVGIGVPGTGFVFAARQEGSLVLARRSATLEKVGDAVRFGLGPAAPTMPALAGLNHQAAVFVGLYGKTDLLGATFAIEAKPAKPEKIALDDPAPPTEGDRNSITASYMPRGDLFVAFADGKTGGKHARMTVLGGDLKSKVAVFDLTKDGNISELRVVATGDDKALVTYLQQGASGYEIKTAQVTCH